MAQYELGAALDTDYYGAFRQVPEADRAWWATARRFVTEVLPEVAEAWDTATYPRKWLTRLAGYGLFNDGVAGSGVEPCSPLAAGLITMELSRGDGSIATMVGVQAGLVMRSIALFGSEEQRATWLGPLARAERVGAFALTEPNHGSDSVSLETTAVRDGDSFVLNGEKRWIGNGSVGDITVVWARDEAGDVRGFLVPQDSPGYRAETITGKVSLRAIHQAHIWLTDVRVPSSAMLPHAKSFRDTAQVLAATRLGVAWGATGHATAMFECALTYARERTQFGKPLAAFQLVQSRLSEMLADLTSMQLHCLELAKREADGTITPTQASLAKLHTTRTARRIGQHARDLLGGNGILLEHHVVRHVADVEAIHTYEGTESIQSLLVGRDLTGFGAFT